MAVTVFRSSEQNAPPLAAVGGSLIDVLTACLVDGYGSAFASGTVVCDGTAPADGDTLTIGSVTYTFKTSAAGQPANTIPIGTATVTMQRLQMAINQSGTGGNEYSVGTLPHPDVWAGLNVLTLTLTARKGGAAANAVALARAAAGTPHLTVSGATLAGGGGTNGKAAAGWTRPYVGPGQAAFRQGGGNGFYLDVNDNGPGPALVGEARLRGYETMSAVATGTGPFPTVAQGTAVSIVRKSATAAVTARPWVLIADDRTFYLFIQAGDSAGQWYGVSFGDFFSYASGDGFRTLLIARQGENSVTASAENLDTYIGSGTPSAGKYAARSYTGLGGGLILGSIGDGKSGNTSPSYNSFRGASPFPNPVDGSAWIAPVHLTETGPIWRGKQRGFMHWLHPIAAFADQDTIAGAGAYAGRTFLLFKTTPNGSAYCIDITGPWPTN